MQQLPPGWVAISSGSIKTFSRLGNLRDVPEVSHSVTLNPDCTWRVHIYGNSLDPQRCPLLEDISSTLDSDSLLELLQILENSKICTGHPEKEFVSLLKKRKGSTISHSGNRSAYLDKSIPVIGVDCVTVAETVRSSRCEILTRRPQRCLHCMDYRSNLRAMQAKEKKAASSPVNNRVESSSHTNYRYHFC